MASPSAAGMAAVVAQYIHENHLDQQEGLTVRTLAQSLLMGTAIPTMDPNGEVEYAPRSQGAGLANVARAVSSPTYLLVDGQPDGKVKAGSARRAGPGDWCMQFPSRCIISRTAHFLSSWMQCAGAGLVGAGGGDLCLHE
ncbi:MAG: hypothetical protein ACLU9S_22740 [Oscillospiraceae bacterium]